VLAKEKFAALGPGNHGSTFGGNPLAMAAVKAVLGVVNDEAFLEEVRFKGKVLKSALEVLAERVPAPRSGARGCWSALISKTPTWRGRSSSTA
jgi:acetylornithine/N-succinyldiaminopimelate aminotransferase